LIDELLLLKEEKRLGDNSLGERFVITSFGESHGDLIGIIIDGVPAGLKLNLDSIQRELDMRRPGASKFSSSRAELDKVKVLSGVFNNMTTGAPLCLIIENKDIDSSNYEIYRKNLRPSHIDFSIFKKYGGFADYRGSGRFSGRITVSFVLAGAIAKQILEKLGIIIFAYTKSIGKIIDDNVYQMKDYTDLLKRRENSSVRTIDSKISYSMEKLVIDIKDQKDSIGGTLKCTVYNFPAGVGGPVFNSIESKLSHAIFSIPAIKGIEFGAGFKSAEMKGSEHNDPWIIENGKIRASKNDAGGIIGGISTGMPIEFTIAVKPVPTIGLPQKTVNIDTMQNVEIEFSGRHDVCIVPRIILVVEAMTAIVLTDFLLIEGIIPQIFKS
jgi:chorismate synthase